MNVGELIQELQKLDPNLNVMAVGEEAEKVIVENSGEYEYVRIFNPWNVHFVSSPRYPIEIYFENGEKHDKYGEKTTGNPYFPEESNTVPQDMGRYDTYTDQFIKE